MEVTENFGEARKGHCNLGGKDRGRQSSGVQFPNFGDLEPLSCNTLPSLVRETPQKKKIKLFIFNLNFKTGPLFSSSPSHFAPGYQKKGIV